MANFAELDANNVVLRVVVVSNAELMTPEGYESEEKGVAFCVGFFGGGTWKQTSYNGKFRKCFAGAGYSYDPALDVFTPPHPEDFPSWTFNENTWIYEPPVPEPTENRYLYRWDEPTVSWVLKTNPPPQE